MTHQLIRIYHDISINKSSPNLAVIGAAVAPGRITTKSRSWRATLIECSYHWLNGVDPMVEDFLWLIVAKECLIPDAVFTVLNGEGSACIL